VEYEVSVHGSARHVSNSDSSSVAIGDPSATKVVDRSSPINECALYKEKENMNWTTRITLHHAENSKKPPSFSSIFCRDKDCSDVLLAVEKLPQFFEKIGAV